MSNFQEKYNNWVDRMSQKSEKEKHNYALTVAFLISGIVFFFVASNWYFQISGNNFNSSLFTDIEQIYNTQKLNFSQASNVFGAQKNAIFQTVSGSDTVKATTTFSGN